MLLIYSFFFFFFFIYPDTSVQLTASSSQNNISRSQTAECLTSDSSGEQNSHDIPKPKPRLARLRSASVESFTMTEKALADISQSPFPVTRLRPVTQILENQVDSDLGNVPPVPSRNNPFADSLIDAPISPKLSNQLDSTERSSDPFEVKPFDKKPLSPVKLQESEPPNLSVSAPPPVPVRRDRAEIPIAPNSGSAASALKERSSVSAFPPCPSGPPPPLPSNSLTPNMIPSSVARPRPKPSSAAAPPPLPSRPPSNLPPVPARSKPPPPVPPRQ